VKCDICGKKTYIIHINKKHQKVCDNCYYPDGVFIYKCKIDPLRFGGNYKRDKMYYKPKYFELHELLPRGIYNKYVKTHETALWGLFDERILRTVDQLREIYGRMTANTWKWGGSHQYRGYRPGNCKIGAFFSQHKYGRGIDLIPSKYKSQDIRDDIKQNFHAEAFRYITCIEEFEGMPWLHIDCRNWDKEKHGVLIVGK